tara:strand:+ start:801 stop:1868 length:1068 start_codon:yes stop_codon:yes gene_type:complete
MRIAIVGAGNAGCITALHYHRYLEIDNEIVIYHSPEQHPIERVGQGTVSTPLELISATLDINWYDNPIDLTYKAGVLYEGWGNGSNFFHGSISMLGHFVPHKLSKAVLESGHFKVIEKTVTDPEEEIDADVIFDCRGRHNRDKSNYDTLINPLNSVLLYQKEGRDPDLLHTRSVATPNGWTFVIPNKDSVSYGYLYNNTITSKEDATEDFLDRFDLPNIDGELTFENYVAKNMFVGDRTILQGNRFGFIEPFEANALGIYQSVARQAWDGIFKIKDLSLCNLKIRIIMKEIETFILWNYRQGSKYDTPFWEYAKSLPFNPDETFNKIIHDPDSVPTGYGQWAGWSFKQFKKHYQL